MQMTKRFTLDEANRMLPLVQRIVKDAMEAYARWQEVVHEYEVAAAMSRADLPDERALVMQGRAQDLAREIKGYVRELTDLGIEFKGFDLGLVDFPSDRDGRIVYLCWKYGEESITHWHEVDAGFAGRQKLS